MYTRRIIVVLIAGLAAGALLSGCGGSKVTRSNFDKIENGMTVSQVEGILGKGAEQAGGGASLGGVSLSGKVMVWQDGTKKISVTFANGKVVGKVQEGL